ncbi:MAG: hypothetical protein JXB10_19410 [Pirellulales bacterium]|nr:hypothetical protein [Pirellulales bacterium]
MVSTFHRTRRRGVLLLVILGLLALFGLIAVAFVILSGQAQRSAQTAARIEQSSDIAASSQSDLNEALMQALRGSANSASILGPHGLLEDVYGNNSHLTVGGIEYYPEVDNPVNLIAGGQIVEFPIVFLDAAKNPVSDTAIKDSLRAEMMRRIGCVMTFTGDPQSAPCAGQSTRLLGITSLGNLQVSALGGYLPLQHNTFIINGPPFSGTGYGYDPRTGRLDVARFPNTDPNLQIPCSLLLRPFLNEEDYTNWLTNIWPLGNNGQDDGGSGDDRVKSSVPLQPYPNWMLNEGYDAPDYQNPILGAQMVTASGVQTLPSLHRPALVSYWYNKLYSQLSSQISPIPCWGAIIQPFGPDGNPNTDDGYCPPSSMSPQIAQYILDLKRRILLRPLPEDHPNFTGSNASSRQMNFVRDASGQIVNPSNPTPLSWEFATNGQFDFNNDGLPDSQYDVDNDGDGVPDSVWVDLGFPVRSAPDGRKYKPLFAILCVDLDGRLNLNAHGNLAQTDQYYFYNLINPQSFTFAGGGYPTLRGQGYGPAEINLSPLFLSNPTFYSQLLVGGTPGGTPGGVYYEGRYGSSRIAGTGVDPLIENKWSVEYGKWYDYNDGQYKAPDYWASVYQKAGYANIVPGAACAYGSPPDPFGVGAVGLDPGGRPVYAGTSTYQTGGSLMGIPYALQLTPETSRGLPLPSPVNNPFSVNELERILRPFDRDTVTLPDRLAALTSQTGRPEKSILFDRRHQVTTESWNIPGLSVQPLSPAYRNQAVTDYADTNNPIFRNWIALWMHPQNALDLLTATYYCQLRNNPTNPLDPGEAMTETETMVLNNALQLFPPEMLAGLKMNINRPFGNGRDDPVDPNNGLVDYTSGKFNGVVDEPQSAENPVNGESGVNGASGEVVELRDKPGTTVKPLTRYSPRGLPTAADPAWPVGPALNSLQARQDEARYLYVTAMMTIEQDAMKKQLKEILHSSKPTTDQELARYLAQWAVNVVDFRDRDSIMTPFEYDVYPFADDINDNTKNPSKYTWNVDGVLGVNPVTGESDDSQPRRGLVWGCERPELLIGETLALHDRRTEDLDSDDGDKATTTTENSTTHKKDDDFDQRKKPEGSLFVELYNPWTESEPVPAELYSTKALESGDRVTGVDLMRRAGTGAETEAPVWRLVIIYGNDGLKNPDDYKTTPGDNNRSIYFVRPPNPTDLNLKDGCQPNTRYYPNPTDDNAYFKDRDKNKMLIIPRRGYAVIGPGAYDSHYPVGKDPSGKEIHGAYVTFFGRRTDAPAQDDPNIYDERRPVRHFFLSPKNPLAQTPFNRNNKAGVGDSAVNDTIQKVTSIVVNCANNQPRRLSISEPTDLVGYPDYPKGLTYYNPPKDRPFDYDRKAHLDEDPVAEAVLTNGTTPHVCTIHLQRLANPLLPFDPDLNPYRTIDTSPIDLIAFNGWESDKAELSKLFPQQQAGAKMMVEARQRGDKCSDQSAPGINNIWIQQTKKDLKTTPEGGDPDSSYVFKYKLQTTLGYLNTKFEPRITDQNSYYKGDPQGTPFPWLNWNNRPYVSEMELMLVPAASSYDLLRRYNLNAPTTQPYQNYVDSYPHLLNFFASNDVSSPNHAPELSRLLEYVGVPSRFVGTEIQGNPTFMALPDVHNYHPPFNMIPSYREPGKINLNTIYRPEVLQGLLNVPNSSALWANIWQNFVSSRRGYPGSPQTNILAMNANYPTQFARPFRSAAESSLVPPVNLMQPDREINATLLRAENPSNPIAPLFNYVSSNAVDNTDRNPYFRYQALQRLANLTTTRSNVYAVWITVGYFEVTPATLKQPYYSMLGLNDAQKELIKQQIYPDGYELGQELGAETGEFERHRGFYIIDRSIPVGFQRGQDLNAENTILLKRYIE